MSGKTQISGKSTISGKIRTYVVLTLLAIFTTSQAAQAGCLSGQQVRADQIKFVQANLTAAALYCRGNRRDQILKIYNHFISRYRNELQLSLADLAHYYQSEMVSNYGSALDAHITLQTNYILAVSSDVPAFCDEILTNTAELVAMPDVDSVAWLNEMPIGYEPVIKACQAPLFRKIASSE